MGLLLDNGRGCSVIIGDVGDALRRKWVLLGVLNVVHSFSLAVDKSMAIEVALLGESLSTFGAFKPFLRTMHKHMTVEVALLSEPLAAVLASKDLLFAVHKPMAVEVAKLGEPFTAFVTSKSLHHVVRTMAVELTVG